MNIIPPVQDTNNIRYADFMRLTTRTRQTSPFTAGITYTILSTGTTDFTAIGATSNTPGTVFTATGTPGTLVGSGTGIAAQNVSYNFSTAPAPIKVTLNPSAIVTTQSVIYNYFSGYNIYLYMNFDPASVGIQVGQYVVGEYTQSDTVIIDIGYDVDENFYYLTLSKPTFDTPISYYGYVNFCTTNDAVVNFNGLGQLVNVGSVTRDIKSTANETTFTLVGIDTAMLSLVLSSDIKGSSIEAWHGFFNTSGALITTGGTGGLYKFFTGYINSFSISEQWMDEIRMYVGAVTVAASSIQIILRNRVAGRYTNDSSWQFFNPGDTSMNRVSFISTINYQFGKTT